jgi:hypothetical protein
MYIIGSLLGAIITSSRSESTRPNPNLFSLSLRQTNHPKSTSQMRIPLYCQTSQLVALVFVAVTTCNQIMAAPILQEPEEGRNVSPSQEANALKRRDLWDIFLCGMEGFLGDGPP